MAKFSVVFSVFWCFKSGLFLFKMDYIVDLDTSEGYTISLMFILVFQTNHLFKISFRLVLKVPVNSQMQVQHLESPLDFFFHFLIWSFNLS